MTTLAFSTDTNQWLPTSSYQDSKFRPTLRGYFGVDPTNEAQAITRIQDAAHSGMNVFVEPGTYRLDPDHPLLFDTLPTIFRGAGSGLANFTSVDFSLTGNLFDIRVGGCGLEGMTVAGEQMFASGTPNTNTLVYVNSPTTDVPNDFFTARDLHLIGGQNGLNLTQIRKAHLSNIVCAEQTGHGLTVQTNALSDLNIDGLLCYHIRAEGISISDFINGASATVVEAGGRITINNYKAKDTAQAFDAFLTTTRLLIIDNMIADRCRGGAIELKVKYDQLNAATNPNEGAQLISISNLKMRNASVPVGNAAIVLDWGVANTGGSPINPPDVQRKIEMHDITVDYDVNAAMTSTAPVISIQGQVDIEVDGLRVSGAATNMVQLSSPGAAGAGAMATRVNLGRLVTAGGAVIGALLVDTNAGVDRLHIHDWNVHTTSHPIRFNSTYAKNVTIDGSLIASTGTGRPIFITSSVVELNVNGAHLKPIDFGVYASTFTATPALATLPNVSGCVTSVGLIKVTFASAHGLATDDAVFISGVVGTTEANDTWLVTVVDTTSVTLQSSVFANAYVSGGTARRASKLILDNVLFRKSTGSAIRVDHDLYLFAFGCRCNTPVASGGINNTSSSSKIRAQLCRGFLSAAPVSTAGFVGDFFLNYLPTAGGAWGWICTTTGTTSTTVWKAMGIAA